MPIHVRKRSTPQPMFGQLQSDSDTLLTTEAEQQVLETWNATEAGFRVQGSGVGSFTADAWCLHQLIEAQAARTPDAIAVVFDFRDKETRRQGDKELTRDQGSGIRDQDSRVPALDPRPLTPDPWYLTYHELNRRANQLAWYLRKHGVGPETLVGICVARTPAMLVGLLGILKAGGAYVPLDPTYPRDRQAFVLADSRCPVLITDSIYDLRLTIDDLEESQTSIVNRKSKIVNLHADWAIIAQAADTPLDSGVRPENPAYVIYTSGSTGTPKGVVITHRSAVAFIAWALSVFSPEQLRGVLAGTSICFDLSVFELFVTLSGGGTIILAEHVLALAEHPAAQAITLINSVPSAVTELLRINAIPPSAQTINLAGEPLPLKLMQQLYQQATIRRVVNLYGPSEDTTYSTYSVLERAAAQPPAIGVPISNTQVYLLDDRMRPVALGTPGELYLGGTGLARGYLNRPDLTAERFVPNPFLKDEGGRLKAEESQFILQPSSFSLYKTGDLARYRADGQIEFLGRRDHQVKLRGYRIELGEVAAALYQHAAVSECVVVVREDEPGDRRLVAYIAEGSGIRGQGSGVETARRAVSTPDPRRLIPDLRSFLHERLPEYMVPSVFVLLDALPLTPNGKIDRAALPAPARSRPALDHAYTPPRTDLEVALATIWAQVLELTPVGIHDHFIELGGHSLHATRILARIQEGFHIGMTVRNLFELPTIAQQSAAIAADRQTAAHQSQPLVPIARDGSLLPSFAQQRLWLLDQWEPGNPVYNIPLAIRMVGALDLATLQRSLNTVVQRHETLRTTFADVDGLPIPVIADQGAIKLLIADLSAMTEPARELQARQISRNEGRHRFDLAHGPLVRAVLLRLNADEHILVLVLHHIVSDDWSMGVLFHELGSLYAAYRADRPAPLPALSIQYIDFALWQRQWLQGAVQEEQLTYWRRALAGASATLDLPTDRPRPLSQSFKGAMHTFLLPAQLVEQLAAMSRQQGVTLFMSLLAAFDVLLARYSGQDDIVVGSPIAGRTRIEIEPLIGFFINTLVLRINLGGNPSFQELLERTREVCLGAYAHQDLPFEQLVEALQPTRDPSRQLLFQIMLVLQNAPAQPLELDGLTLTPGIIDNQTAKLDLTLYLEELAHGLRGVLEYSTDLFDATTVMRLAGQFQTLLTGIVADPRRPFGQLPLLTRPEQQQLVHEWNASARPLPEASLLARLAAQAARTPDAVAASFATAQLTYAALHQRASQLAHALRQHGAGPDVLVALCVERSLDMLVGMLAILHAGAAYLPLDPDYPAARLAFMLEDSQATILLVATKDEGRWTMDDLGEADTAIVNRKSKIVNLKADWPQIARLPTTPPPDQPNLDHLAYVIYTSGSTGNPKGVMVRQRGLLNLCDGLRAFFDHPQVQHTGVLTSISFDISVNQIFPTLLNGRTLHIVADAVKLDSPAFLRWVQQWRIQVLDGVPSYLQAVLSDLAPRRLATDLRYLLIGGEPLTPALLTALFGQLGDAVQVVNIYGLTEISDINILGVISAADLARPITVGQPLQNNQVYLLDRAGALVPVGVIGEVCIAGMSVSRGYLGRPDLTAEKFIPNPFADFGFWILDFGLNPIQNPKSKIQNGERLCRTGDLGRRLADGTLMILGRRDTQVKVRGYRIELGEIEAALRGYAAVREGAVVARADTRGETRLVAYVVPTEDEGRRTKDESAPSSSVHRPSSVIPELRSFLQARLPVYMVPSIFVMLDVLPRTPNGKIDRNALPPPTDHSTDADDAYVAPRTPIEGVMATMWQESLQITRIGIHDNFFDLGGHSLSATRIISRIRQAFQITLTARQLFETPTVAALAEYMITTERKPGRTDAIARALQRLQRMSANDRQQILQQKKSSEDM